MAQNFLNLLWFIIVNLVSSQSYSVLFIRWHAGDSPSLFLVVCTEPNMFVWFCVPWSLLAVTSSNLSLTIEGNRWCKKKKTVWNIAHISRLLVFFSPTFYWLVNWLGDFAEITALLPLYRSFDLCLMPEEIRMHFLFLMHEEYPISFNVYIQSNSILFLTAVDMLNWPHGKMFAHEAGDVGFSEQRSEENNIKIYLHWNCLMPHVNLASS